jgi:CHAT domain-containing protein
LPTGATGYLVDAPAVLHYMLAERDLLQRPSSVTGGSLLALGAPDFDHAERPSALRGLAPLVAASNSPVQSRIPFASPTPATSPALPASVMASNVEPSRRGGAPCEASIASRFEPLPATDVEVQHIASLWRRADVTLLAGARASETALKTLAPGRRVLHVATHGFFLDRDCAAPAAAAPTAAAQTTAAPAHRMLEESPLLRSGLVLAGANSRARTDTSDDADDGILTAEEIAGLDLSGAQWAVLSACDTGRGDWQAGEGVVGLRRAFQMAGARTVILSLWPVLDTVTARWMTELYRYKWTSRSMTTAAAVRAANRTLLASRRAKGESTHPLYWSGFIATGDWR